MEFTWPFMLPLLLIVPLLVAFYILMQRRRQSMALRYADLSLVREALDRGPGLSRHVPPLMMLGAIGVMLFAMARPVAVVTVPAQDATVILTIDISGSMAADDLKPSRMEAAKTAARSFVDHQPQGVQIGVVSFSDEASVIQTPTNNRDAIMEAIDRLQPEGGTAIGSALTTSVDTLLNKNKKAPSADTASAAAAPVANPARKGSYDAGFVVLLTDGENTWGPSPMESIQSAVENGVRVYTVGVGSPDGSILHINGQSLRAGLDESTLKQLADLTGGKYYNAMNSDELKAIYDNLSARLVMKTERTEITAGFTAAAAVLSLAAALLSMLWFNRMF